MALEHSQESISDQTSILEVRLESSLKQMDYQDFFDCAEYVGDLLPDDFYDNESYISSLT